jgi:hypothetical protein
MSVKFIFYFYFSIIAQEEAIRITRSSVVCKSKRPPPSKQAMYISQTIFVIFVLLKVLDVLDVSERKSQMFKQ